MPALGLSIDGFGDAAERGHVESLIVLVAVDEEKPLSIDAYSQFRLQFDIEDVAEEVSADAALSGASGFVVISLDDDEPIIPSQLLEAAEDGPVVRSERFEVEMIDDVAVEDDVGETR